MNTRHTLAAAAAAASAVIASLSACSVFEDDSNDHVPVTDTSLYSGVPAGAIRAAEGYGTVHYRASAPGRVIVGDDSRRTVVTETTVRAGDEITVDSEGDRVLVNGVPVYQQNLQKHDQHSIYFVAQQTPQTAPTQPPQQPMQQPAQQPTQQPM